MIRWVALYIILVYLPVEMNYKSKIQKQNKAGYQQYWVTIPVKLAEAMKLEAGATVEWKPKGRNKLEITIN